MISMLPEIYRARSRTRNLRDTLNILALNSRNDAFNAWEMAVGQVRDQSLVYETPTADDKLTIVRPVVIWWNNYDAFVRLVYEAFMANGELIEVTTPPDLAAMALAVAKFVGAMAGKARGGLSLAFPIGRGNAATTAAGGINLLSDTTLDSTAWSNLKAFVDAGTKGGPFTIMETDGGADYWRMNADGTMELDSTVTNLPSMTTLSPFTNNPGATDMDSLQYAYSEMWREMLKVTMAKAKDMAVTAQQRYTEIVAAFTEPTLTAQRYASFADYIAADLYHMAKWSRDVINAYAGLDLAYVDDDVFTAFHNAALLLDEA